MILLFFCRFQILYIFINSPTTNIMTDSVRGGSTTGPQTSLLEVLKKKMRQANEETEATREETQVLKSMLEDEKHAHNSVN